MELTIEDMVRVAEILGVEMGAFGGAEMDPGARATAMAERGGVRGAHSGINSFLLDGIIEFLEAKVQ